MPRRGEHRSGFPPARTAEPSVSRIGVRRVTAPATGQAALHSATAVLSFDPASFACARLAAELADEWVELVQAGRLRETAGRSYLTAMKDFLTHVDSTVAGSGSASLARSSPDLYHAVTEWIRILPSRHAPGSRTPGWHAGRVRALIARRAEHPDRPVAGHLNGWIAGALGVRRDARVADSLAGAASRHRGEELDNLRSSLEASRRRCRQLQDQVDAAATVISALAAENTTLRRQAMNTSAVVVPLQQRSTVRA